MRVPRTGIELLERLPQLRGELTSAHRFTHGAWIEAVRDKLSPEKLAESQMGYKAELHSIEIATPFYVDTNICSLLSHQVFGATMQQKDELKLLPEMVTEPNGLAYFPYLELPSATDEGPASSGSYVLVWDCVGTSMTIKFYRWMEDEQAWGWGWDDDWLPCFTFVFIFGKTVQDSVKHYWDALQMNDAHKLGTLPPHHIFSTATAAVAYSFFAFSSQKLVHIATPQAINRAEQRVMKKAKHIPLVVQLRVRKNVNYVERDQIGEEREYSHRWVVRPHWRNQWYPSEGIHRPVFIEEYIKGPDDKPLLIRPLVFSVER